MNHLTPSKKKTHDVLLLMVEGEIIDTSASALNTCAIWAKVVQFVPQGLQLSEIDSYTLLILRKSGQLTTQLKDPWPIRLLEYLLEATPNFKGRIGKQDTC